MLYLVLRGCAFKILQSWMSYVLVNFTDMFIILYHCTLLCCSRCNCRRGGGGGLVGVAFKLVRLSATKILTWLISSEVLTKEHCYLACTILVTNPFNWHHAMTLTCYKVKFVATQGTTILWICLSVYVIFPSQLYDAAFLMLLNKCVLCCTKRRNLFELWSYVQISRSFINLCLIDIVCGTSTCY